MNIHRSMPEPVATVRRQVSAVFVLLPLLLLPLSPGLLFAQQDITVSLDKGDRVRVWSPEAELSGEDFNFQRLQEDSIVLMEPREVTLTKLSWRQIEDLHVRTKADGTHFWDGAIIGAGAGMVTGIALSVPYCGQADNAGLGLLCFGYGSLIRFFPVTILPGGLLGGLVGSGFPKYEWVSMQLAPAAKKAQVESFAGSADPGISVQLNLRPPALP